MARLSYSVQGQTSVILSVVELNESATYSSIYITCNGQSSPNLARSGNNYSSDRWQLDGLSPGTTYYAEFHIVSSGGSTASGGTTFTTEFPPRPSNWYWDTPKTSGSSFNLTASEWNRFTERINQFRTYKGFGGYPFEYVLYGTPVLARQINDAVYALRDITSVPVEAIPGYTATADLINTLSNNLNYIY